LLPQTGARFPSRFRTWARDDGPARWLTLARWLLILIGLRCECLGNPVLLRLFLVGLRFGFTFYFRLGGRRARWFDRNRDGSGPQRGFETGEKSRSPSFVRHVL